MTIEDYTEMTELWKRADLTFKPSGRDSKEAIAAQMFANPRFFFGAFENGYLVGTALLSSDMRRGWVNRLAVDPKYRHHGIAQALINESEKELKKRGIRIFCALIDESNTSSKELFRKCGYVEHKDIVYFSKHGSDMI